MTHHLIGVTEMADLLRLSRQRCDQLSRTKGFPEPVAELASGRVWNTEDIKAWVQEQEKRKKSMTTRSELNRLTIAGAPPAPGVFISTFMLYQRAAFGHGKHAGEIAATRRAVFERSYEDTKAQFPDLHVAAPQGWFDEQ